MLVKARASDFFAEVALAKPSDKDYEVVESNANLQVTFGKERKDDI